jgi:hypothetical protein
MNKYNILIFSKLKFQVKKKIKLVLQELKYYQINISVTKLIIIHNYINIFCNKYPYHM